MSSTLKRLHLYALCALSPAAFTACDDGGGSGDPGEAADMAVGGAVGGAGGGAGGAGGTMRVGKLPCDGSATGTVGADGLQLTVDEGALSGAQLNIPEGALPEGTEITLGCGEQALLREGYTPLGPSISITTPEPGLLTGHADITLVFAPEDRPERIKGRHVRLFWQPDNYPYIAEPPVMNPKADLEGGTFSLRTPGLGQFQLGYDEVAGTPETFEFTFRAIGGISMGGAGSAYMGTRYGDVFDTVLPLGGPTDWRYLLWYISERLLGGFCAHDQGDGLGAWCGPPGPSDPLEHDGVSMLNWYFDDSGGSFDRDSYLSIFHDLAYAYGNPILYNPASPYLPPGMPEEWLKLPNEVRCAPECRGDDCPPVDLPFSIPDGFYDDEFNPDGTLPVIPFCDGEDGEPLGFFDGEAAHNEPVEVTYAVDLNGNGRRDEFEPVIRNLSEPYEDVGCDGIPSTEEAGYDPVSNPDPAGDDYHWYRNPTGTENSWLYDDCGDEGAEPYEDVGLDGVPDTPSFDEGGYDWGQGNGVFDYNPNVARMLERNPAAQYQALPDQERRRMRFWNDGGIRDIFNLGVAHSHFMGQVQSTGENVRIYEGFPALLPTDAETYTPSDDLPDPFGDAGTHVLIRYGNPDATPAELEEGDGKHVGSVAEALNRFITMLDWLHHRWPDGNFDRVRGLARDDDLVFFDSERLGKQYRFSISLPAGYFAEENADVRYPVMVLMHGYGQSPGDLDIAGLLASTNAARGLWQKSILLYPEGFCGKASQYQCNDGVDNDGDGFVDSGNDIALRVACEGDDDCSRDYTCRNDFCCPPDWPDCGPPDPECGDNSEGRSEAGDPEMVLCADGVDNDLDGLIDLDDAGCMGLTTLDTEEDCKRGNFYTDHPSAKDGSTPGPDYEGAVLDMLEYVDENYRTRAPETLTIVR
ncbi:MAG: hypothetical protein ACE366_06275 [Bradymonadia bacterium]